MAFMVPHAARYWTGRLSTMTNALTTSALTTSALTSHDKTTYKDYLHVSSRPRLLHLSFFALLWITTIACFSVVDDDELSFTHSAILLGYRQRLDCFLLIMLRSMY